MPYFHNEGVKIYYEIEGAGPPVILIHGFASSLESNWKQAKWIKVLKDKYRLILIDCRGHGKSDKPHEESEYGQKMTEDVVKLMDHLSIEKANFLGYSMGAYMTFRLLLIEPHLFISAILGRFVLNFIQDEKKRPNIRKSMLRNIEAFKAESLDDIKDPMARGFRQFAELMGNDLKAMAAVMASLFQGDSETLAFPSQIKEKLKKIEIPVMTVVGSNEMNQGDMTLVAQIVPDACHFQIQGKDHLSVVPDPKFHMIVKAFLDYVNKK
ncbi:MAG: alpha/beta fold hydrolase [Promethearchaeota archaeon]|jgi:pimeloyl-ACP methyl ester carboxylesterase